MKKVFVTIMLAVFLISMTLLGGCKEEEVATPAAPVEETGETSVEEVAEEPEEEVPAAEEVVEEAEEELTIGFLSMLMAIVWEQDMEMEMKELASQDNATIVTMDSNLDPALQLQQLDNMLGTGVDGVVVFIADEKMSQSITDKCTAENVPVMFESIRMIDEDGKLTCPGVELDGYGMGVLCAEWLAQYVIDNGLSDDYSGVGLINLDQPDVVNIWERANGVEDKFFEMLPDFPKENYIRQSMDRDKGGSEAGYDAAMAAITANPQIETWLAVGPNDDQGGGAVRAIEQVGLDENACVVSMGAESAREEWKKEEDTCWKAASFFSAYDCATLVWEGMMELIREGTALEDLWPEYVEEGQTYAIRRFTGTMVTKDNFREVMGKYAE